MNAPCVWICALAWMQVPTVRAPSAPPASNGVPEAPAAPVVERYHGTLTQGLDEMRSASDAGRFDDALGVSDRLLATTSFDAWRERVGSEPGVTQRLLQAADPCFDALGWTGLSASERAAVRYAEGVVATLAEKRERAEPAFQAARGLAGPGDVRLSSIYNLGVSSLVEGEEWRAKIPEVQGASGGASATPQVPTAGPSPGAPGAAPEPDPLDLARQAYVRAKGHLVERVRADWRDADTRANLELVARRLHELDAIQRKRDEQKKEQEKQDKDKQNDKQDSDKDKKDKKDKDDKKSDDKNNDPSQNPEKKDEPKDADKDAHDKPQDQKKDPADEKPADPKDQKKPEDDKSGEPKDEQPADMQEKVLTKEEMIRLLDTLKQHEEEWQKVQAQMRSARRVKVKKDW